MEKPRLFHVSEEGGIGRFEPRPPPSPDAGVAGDAVWAVDEAHLVNYLAPRDCPRITFGLGADTSDGDRARFLSSRARRVVAIEAAWLERLQSARIYVYEMSPERFELALPGAGYWISRTAVEPVAMRVVDNILGALIEAGAEVRLLQDFWPLCDAVAASSLEFSIIRKRNAWPRRS